MPKYRIGVRRGRLTGKYKHIVAGSAAGLLLTGTYLLLLTLSPQISIFRAHNVASSLAQKSITADRIIIPKIGVNIEYRVGGPEVLDNYAWYRFPERGNPIDGGNMIISAHRFSLAATPAETNRRSPFYNIHRLDIGDEIVIHYKGASYSYQIKQTKRVSPVSIDIEAPTTSPILTVYSCTLGGELDGRQVIIAVPAERGGITDAISSTQS